MAVGGAVGVVAWLGVGVGRVVGVGVGGAGVGVGNFSGVAVGRGVEASFGIGVGVGVGVADWVDAGEGTDSSVGLGGCVAFGSEGSQALRTRTIGTAAHNTSLIRITIWSCIHHVAQFRLYATLPYVARMPWHRGSAATLLSCGS